MKICGTNRCPFAGLHCDCRPALMAFVSGALGVQRQLCCGRACTSTTLRRQRRLVSVPGFGRRKNASAFWQTLLLSESPEQSLESLGRLPVDSATSSDADRSQYEKDMERLRSLDPETCQTCQNEGVVVCAACNGSGLRPAEPNEVYRYFCPVCLGQKRVRCPDCGGRCLAC
ncbi:hypothetical protein CCYA_CCYA02G0554 [Cyanidiococcus yangmingshanensis]|nr:hypothetical protein CCYA_CCYA02G0554 [Cyanidiococcus yangmingshanensis]